MANWQCPECGRLIPEIEYLSFCTDVGCAVCHTSLFKFHKVKEAKMTDKIHVLIMNGPAESGKGTVADYIEKLLNWKIKRYSSIDYVKEVAKKFGWDGVKDVKGRNLLSAMKQTMIEFNDLPTKKIINEIQECILFEVDLLICDIREPEEIQKLVDYCKEQDIQCDTCRISNTIKELEAERTGLSTFGDRMYGRYDYTSYVYNNGSLDELKVQVKEIFSDLYINNIPSKPSIGSPGSNTFEPVIDQPIKNICIMCHHGLLVKNENTSNSTCSYCRQVYRAFKGKI